MEEKMNLFLKLISEDLAALSLLHKGEVNKPLLEEMKKVNFPKNLAFELSSAEGKKIIDEFYSYIQNLKTDEETIDKLAADYSAIYLTGFYGVYPYESPWFDEDKLAFQEQMFKVRKWYKKYGLEAEDWRKMPDDHIALELEFLSFLLKKGDRQAIEDALNFLKEHPMQWFKEFAVKTTQRSNSDFYSLLSLLTWAYLLDLKDILEEILNNYPAKV